MIAQPDLMPPPALAAPAPALPMVVVMAPAPVMPLPLLTPVRPADAPPLLSAQVRDVIEAAISSGDPAAVAAVVKFARQTNPETVAQIDTINAAYLARLAAKQAREAAARREALAHAGPFDFWRGSIEAGASRASGNSDTVGLYGSVAIEREGLVWTHRLNARLDYQRSEGATTAERGLIGWQPRRTIGDRLYAYGLAQAESDRFLGYDTRLSAGGGLGVRVVAREGVRFDVEAGPALRYTDFTDDPASTRIAGRASATLRWKVSPTLDLSQDSALYVQAGATNASATTAIDTRLIGKLKARLSYNLTYERDAPFGRDPLDTLSRATLVYSF